MLVGCVPRHKFVSRPILALLLVGVRPSRVVDELTARVDALTLSYRIVCARRRQLGSRSRSIDRCTSFLLLRLLQKKSAESRVADQLPSLWDAVGRSAGSGYIHHGLVRQGSDNKAAGFGVWCGNGVSRPGLSKTGPCWRGSVQRYSPSEEQQIQELRSCLSEVLDVSRELPKQDVQPPMTDYEFERAPKLSAKSWCHWTCWRAQPRPPKRLNQRCRQFERDFWQTVQGKPGIVVSRSWREKELNNRFPRTTRIIRFASEISPTSRRGASRSQGTATISFAIGWISSTWMEDASKGEKQLAAFKKGRWRVCPRVSSPRRVFGAITGARAVHVGAGDSSAAHQRHCSDVVLRGSVRNILATYGLATNVFGGCRQSREQHSTA